MFKRGDVVIYVGKEPTFHEPERKGQIGIVAKDFPHGDDKNVEVRWFEYPSPPRATGGSVFPRNIELLGHVELEEGEKHAKALYSFHQSNTIGER